MTRSTLGRYTRLIGLGSRCFEPAVRGEVFFGLTAALVPGGDECRCCGRGEDVGVSNVVGDGGVGCVSDGGDDWYRGGARALRI